MSLMSSISIRGMIDASGRNDRQAFGALPGLGIESDSPGVRDPDAFGTSSNDHGRR